MNELLKNLINAGGAVGSLGMLYLIVKAAAPMFTRQRGLPRGVARSGELIDMGKDISAIRQDVSKIQVALTGLNGVGGGLISRVGELEDRIVVLEKR